MTISPPTNVKVNHKISPDILASGIDTLVLSIDVEWQNHSFFDHLKEMKELASQENKDTLTIFYTDDQSSLWVFYIKPHGSKGHEWIIINPEFSLTIGNWDTPQSRPSIMVRISSEALWRLGPFEACNDLQKFIQTQHGKITTIKPSRLDICLDLLLPLQLWHKNLDDHFTTRAEDTATYKSHRKLTGFSIGKGNVSARLYDKLKEIKKSKKFWMNLIWNKADFSDNQRVIRVEFQLRREGLKSIGIETLDDLFSHIENIWAYCTEKWLKLQDNPEAHSSQRHTFMWWEFVQNSFLGIQNATPLIRCKTIQTKEKQQFDAIYGNLSSLAAIICEKFNHPLEDSPSLEQVLSDFLKLANKYEKNDFRFSIDTHDKRAKYHRKVDKMRDVNKKRHELNHPCNLPIELTTKEQAEEEKWKNISQLKNSVSVSKWRKGVLGILSGKEPSKKKPTT